MSGKRQVNREEGGVNTQPAAQCCVQDMSDLYSRTLPHLFMERLALWDWHIPVNLHLLKVLSVFSLVPLETVLGPACRCSRRPMQTRSEFFLEQQNKRCQCSSSRDNRDGFTNKNKKHIEIWIGARALSVQGRQLEKYMRVHIPLVRSKLSS